MHPQEKGRENMQNKMMKKYFPVFVLPTLLAFTIGFIVPFIMGVYLSFCKFTTVTDAKFVGLQNYVKIFTEDGTFGPSSIAWIMWHIIYWWHTTLDYNFGDGTLKKEDITWPGSVEKAKEEIKTLHDKWVEKLINMSDVEYQSQQYAKWPLEGRSFADIALWLNGELMKNVAEIGYGRFLYAACKK
jgi:hypothetical protein